jgi:hypothetical protein
MGIDLTQFEPQVLGQVRPANTSNTVLHNPDNISILRGLFVCNTSGASVTYRIFLDNDGTTYDRTTALFWDTLLDPDTTVLIETIDGLILNNSSANIAVRTSVADAITFTLYGEKKITQ